MNVIRNECVSNECGLLWTSTAMNGSTVNVVGYDCGLWWRMFSYEIGLLWTWSVMNEICHESGLLLMWSIVNVVYNDHVCNECGLLW